MYWTTLRDDERLIAEKTTLMACLAWRQIADCRRAGARREEMLAHAGMDEKSEPSYTHGNRSSKRAHASGLSRGRRGKPLVLCSAVAPQGDIFAYLHTTLLSHPFAHLDISTGRL